jgi:hypothetical protein
MKLMSKDGIEMMDVKSIDRDGDRLVLKGKMMGSMATTIYVHPQDLWSAFRLLPWSVIVCLPVLLIKGLLVDRKRQGAKPRG